MGGGGGGGGSTHATQSLTPFSLDLISAALGGGIWFPFTHTFWGWGKG